MEEWKLSHGMEGIFEILAFESKSVFVSICFVAARDLVFFLIPSSSEQPIVVSVDRSSSASLHIFDVVKEVIV